MSDELKKIADDINSTFSELKSEQTTLKGKVDALDDLKLDRMVEDVTLKMETLQKEQAKMQAMMERHNTVMEDENIADEHKKQFDTWFRDFKAGTSEIEIRAMSTNVNQDGGYLVRPELANFVVDRVFETSPLRQVARVETIGTKSLEVLIDDDEAGASWVAEGASGGQTDTPEVGLKEIVAHKIEADPRISTEQLQDSYLNVEEWLRMKVADKFARTENTAFVTGNGVGKPRGFTTYSAAASAGTYERDAISQYNLGATSFGSSTASDGLIALQNSLKEPYQPRAVFGMKRATYGSVLKSKGADNYFFGMQLLKDGNLQAQLLGKPVIFMDDMPAEQSAALAVVYADFSTAYTIVDRVGLQVLRDPYTNKGFVTYYTTKRVGGDVTNFESIVLGKLSA